MRSDVLRSYAVATAAAAAFLFTTSSATAQMTVPLGNLFDDPAGTPLADAIASDTYAATAQASDLGVETATLGGLGADSVPLATGINFNFVNVGGQNDAWTGIANDAAYNSAAIRTTGEPMGTNTNPDTIDNEEQGIGMHANALITFNLNEIRDAGGLGATPFTFTGEGGLNDDAGPGSVRSVVLVSDATGVIAGYVNGQAVSVTESGGVYSFSGTIPAVLTGAGNAPAFNVPLSSDAMFLTLVMTSGGDGYGSDQGVFSMAQLDAVPEPASLALLALGGMGMLARRRRM